MSDNRDGVGPERNRKDTAEYSSSKAPETRREAEEETSHYDPRLKPGGAHGASADVGMSGVDRESAISGGQSSGQERPGEMRKD